MPDYYFKPSDGADVGPIGVEEFRQRQETGEIAGGTMVWRSGMVEWATCDALCAAERSAAQPPKLPVPVAPMKARSPDNSPRAGFHPCGSCGLEWPEGLLFPHGRQRICGNCQNRQEAQAKIGRRTEATGNGFTAWFLIAGSIVCAGCLAYKIAHPGPPVPHQRAQELTAPATYGR